MTKSSVAPTAETLSTAIHKGLKKNAKKTVAKDEYDFVAEMIEEVARLKPSPTLAAAKKLMNAANKVVVQTNDGLKGDVDHCADSSPFTAAAYALRRTLEFQEQLPSFERILEEVAVPAMQDIEHDDSSDVEQVKVYMNFTRCAILPNVLAKPNTKDSKVMWVKRLVDIIDEIEAGGDKEWKKQKQLFLQEMVQMIIEKGNDKVKDYLSDYFTKLARVCKLKKGLFLASYYDFVKRQLVSYEDVKHHFEQCGTTASSSDNIPNQSDLITELRKDRVTDNPIKSIANLGFQSHYTGAGSKEKPEDLLDVFGSDVDQKMERYDLFTTLMNMDIKDRV